MKLDDFEMAVIDLAHQGVRLTVANVVARLKVEPSKAERWLDELATNGRLDLEIDEDEGLVFYRVRGLSVQRRAKRSSASGVTSALAGYRDQALRHTAEATVRERLGMGEASASGQRKSILAGLLLGLVFPGVGLFYAAPWLAAIAATLAALVIWKLAWIPLLGWALGTVFVFGSGVAGGLYAAEFNKHGRRTALLRKESNQLPISR